MAAYCTPITVAQKCYVVATSLQSSPCCDNNAGYCCDEVPSRGLDLSKNEVDDVTRPAAAHEPMTSSPSDVTSHRKYNSDDEDAERSAKLRRVCLARHSLASGSCRRAKTDKPINVGVRLSGDETMKQPSRPRPRPKFRSKNGGHGLQNSASAGPRWAQRSACSVRAWIPHFPVLSLPVRVIGWQTAPVTWSRFAVAAMTSR